MIIYNNYCANGGVEVAKEKKTQISSWLEYFTTTKYLIAKSTISKYFDE